VPLQAVSQQGDQTWVYVVSPANRVEDRPIKVGIQTATEAEVVSGAAEGESVIVSDRSSLKPGQEVRPQPVSMLQYHGTSQE
jgi:multidrug efflux pump subunit AcrA (membrane-fusion protein)